MGSHPGGRVVAPLGQTVPARPAAEFYQRVVEANRARGADGPNHTPPTQLDRSAGIIQPEPGVFGSLRFPRTYVWRVDRQNSRCRFSIEEILSMFPACAIALGASAPT